MTTEAWMNDYNSTLNSATKEILEAVRSVSHLDDDSGIARRVGEIVQQAAKFWFRMGSQRYRIIVVLQDVDKLVGDGREGDPPAKLVAKPTLLRTGNFMGQDLDDIRDEAVVE
jgi:hypothetical protein